MQKQEQYFRKIAEYKERFRKLPTEKLRRRLQNSGGFLYKEAAIALRELLGEREQQLLEENNVEPIRLIRKLHELHDTCYFELLPGKYEGNCWNQNSVFIAEEVFGYLEPVFERHEPEYDHYAFMGIEKDAWALIASDFSSLIQLLEQTKDVQELEGKVGFLFKDSMSRFASDFQANVVALVGILRELLEWLEEQLKNYDCISVLGM